MDINGRLDRSLSMSDHSAAQWEQEEQCWENEDSSDSAFNLGLGLIGKTKRRSDIYAMLSYFCYIHASCDTI